MYVFCFHSAEYVKKYEISWRLCRNVLNAIFKQYCPTTSNLQTSVSHFNHQVTKY